MKNKEKIYKEFLKMKEKDTSSTTKKRSTKKKQPKEELNEEI